MLPFHSLPSVSVHMSLSMDTHVRCIYVDVHVASLRGTGVLVILPLPNNKKKATRFQSNLSKITPMGSTMIVAY